MSSVCRERRGARSAAALLLGLGVLTILAAFAQTERASTGSPIALMVEIRGAIGPAMSDFFVRAIEKAEERNARILVVQLDTPGGLDSSMRDMIRAILSANVPVVTFVAPSGARAASAGTYLMYASHVAAMAPATNLGAATPVQLGGSPGAEPPSDPESKSTDDQSTPASAGERKAVNDAVAYIRGLAELRGRNADWAESAVRSAASLSAGAALEQGVIDVVAVDVAELLKQIDGKSVGMPGGARSLATAGLAIEYIEPDWRTRALAVITNPNVAYLLMLVGIYGLLLEGYNPGAIFPGVIGGISLLLGLYALQVLPVNYAGLALMALGVALIVAEAFAPSFGVLGIGGIAAFVGGSIILMDTEIPGFRVARAVIGGVALAGGLGLLLTITLFARSRRRAVVTGSPQLLKEVAVAMEDFQGNGLVRIHGEIWAARSGVPIRAGQALRVQRVDGLTLEVVPIDPGS